MILKKLLKTIFQFFQYEVRKTSFLMFAFYFYVYILL